MAHLKVADDLGVDVEEQVGVVGLRQWAEHESSGRGGVVHEDVDAAELVDGALYQGVDGLGAGGIGYDGHDAASGLRRQLLGRGFEDVLTPGADDDVDALPGKLTRGGLADPDASAGHYRPLAAEFEVHVSAPYAFCVRCKGMPYIGVGQLGRRIHEGHEEHQRVVGEGREKLRLRSG